MRTSLAAMGLLGLVACSSSSESAVPDSAVVSGTPDAAIGGPTAYRITSLSLVDPPFWDAKLTGNCTNVIPYVNTIVGTQVGSGAINALIVFDPASTAPGSSTPAELIFGACDPGLLNCSATASSTHADLTANAMSSGTCLGPVSGTLAPDSPPTISSPTAPCVRMDGQNAALDLAGLRLDVIDFHLGAKLGTGAIPTELTQGLLYGFVTTAEAASVNVPGFDDTLDHFLRGGGSCADGHVDDRDSFESMSGWYIYITFAASKVSFVDER